MTGENISQNQTKDNDVNMSARNTQFGQVVAALFATDCFMCTYCAKSSGILRQGQFENSNLFSEPKWKKVKRRLQYIEVVRT